MFIPQDIIDRLNELDIEEVARRLGLEVSKHKAKCFMHDDHNPSLTFSKAKNIYRCWVCGEGGGPIKLVQDKEGWEFQEACVWLANQFNIWLPEDNRKRSPAKRINKRFISPTNKDVERVFDEEVYSWLIDNAELSDAAQRFLFEERLFKEDVVQKLRIGSVSFPQKGVSVLLSRFGEERCIRSGLVRRGNNGLFFYFYTPCLLFPYYEQDGRLIGVQSRYLGEKREAPRFQFLSSQQTRLFNLPILSSLKQGDQLFISEGITDCIALLSAGKKAVAIPSATIMPQEDLVKLRFYDLHMYPDRDEAGQKAFMELRRFFVNHYSLLKAEILPEGAKDYCDYYITTQSIDGE